MSDRADVVVIGGGIQGAAAALALAEEGVDRVRLLERDDLFEATSSAGAGFVSVFSALSPRPYGDEETVIEHYGLDFYRGLQEEGLDVDYRQHGLVLVAATEDAVSHFERIRREELDAEIVMIDGERVEELTGGEIVGGETYGGVFQPAGAQVFTPKVGRALATKLARAAVEVEPRRVATGLRVAHERVVAVETSTGAVGCDAVVVAAGAWSNELLRPLGVNLACVPQLTSRIITEPLGLPSSLPTLMLVGVTDDGPRLWLRQHEGALLWGGVYRTHPRDMLVGVQRVPTRFDEIPLDGVEACRRVAAAAAKIMPALGRYRSMRLKHGAPCYTPDYRPLVGPVPGIEGLYVLGGDNESGVTHGPGLGKALAEQIVHGASELTRLDAWRIDRFDGRYSSDHEVLAALDPSVTAGLAR